MGCENKDGGAKRLNRFECCAMQQFDVPLVDKQMHASYRQDYSVNATL